MPLSGVRGTETDDPTGVYAVQRVLDAVRRRGPHRRGCRQWAGRSGARSERRDGHGGRTQYDQMTLRRALAPLLGDTMPAGVTSISVELDCSAVTIGLAKLTAAAEKTVRSKLSGAMPVHFEQMDAATPD